MILSAEDAAHLLRRVGFGPSPFDIQSLEGMNSTDAVEMVLDVSQAPGVVPPPDASLASPASSWNGYVAIVRWWIDRMRTTPAPIAEKMALFWHGHFCSGNSKVFNLAAMFNQNMTFRTLGMGSFRALTQAVAVDPAMLRYLDNASNVASAPNENWARECMELFTLGVDQYTQTDVVAAARAWTGHGLDSTGTQYVFNSKRHDSGPKTFFGTTKTWNGPDIIDEILTGASKPIAAAFIANKLWSFLAYPNPEPEVSASITADFLASDDLDITALLRSILNQPQFWSAQARTGLVRSPTEYVVAAMRYSGLASTVAHPENYLASMGQYLFNPPDVAGWGDNSYWVSSAAFWARTGFARAVAHAVDTPSGLLSNAGTLSAADAVQAAFDALGVTSPSAATRAAIEQWAISENTSSDRKYIQPNLIALVLLCPDFQLNQ
jgi:uncharacterized protein (DUF1800 family)